MRVRMRHTISGTRNGVLWPKAGEIVELPDGEAVDMCRAGMAEPVADEDVEYAVPDPADVEVRTEPDGDVEPDTEDDDSDSEQQQKRRGRPKLPRDDSGNIIRE